MLAPNNLHTALPWQGTHCRFRHPLNGNGSPPSENTKPVRTSVMRSLREALLGPLDVHASLGTVGRTGR